MTADMEGIIAIDRLKDHYKHCIRLSASNKINPKNAFDLQLIDYMQDLVSSTEDGQMNFKIASSALDVGAKIYSNRVDCIQSEAQKVASSILMALDGQQHKNGGDNQDDSQMDANTSANSNGLNDSGEGDDQDKNKVSKKKRSARGKNVKTVVEDVNLLDAKIEKMVLGDAFLDGLSQDYDMSCPAALISYNALTQPNCLLTIESSHLRKDYRDLCAPPSTPTARVDLPTIVEESEEDGESSGNQTTSDQTTVAKEPQSQQQQQDADGDVMMKDDSNQVSSDKTTTATTTTTSNNSTLPGQVSNALSNHSSEQYNFVTLITKNVNCAQIIRNNQNNHICPRLENFLFNDRTTTISGLNQNLDDSKILLDNEQPNPAGRPTGGAHEFNPELYDGANDDYGDDHFGDADSVAGDDENQPNNNNENDLIPNLDKIAASKPTEYGYSTEHHRLINTWAGPHAWKVMKAPATAKKGDGAPKSVRKRVKLEQKPIDFSEEFLTSLEKLADKDIRHSADVIRRWKKPLLPQDHNLTEELVRETLIHTFLRPEDTYHCMKTPADALKLVDIDHDYTKTDRNCDDDDTPASPGLGGFDDVHDDSDDEFRADPVVDGNEVAIYGAPINNSLTQQADLEFAGEHLIEQPYTVAQVNIPFAKISKKMDVRKLKRVMWDLLLPPEKRLEQLTMQANITVVENVDAGAQNCYPENGNSTTTTGGDEPNETVVMNGMISETETETGTVVAAKKTPSPTPSESAVHLEFSNLYGELPIRVSSKMANDLSQPIAFVTLLHLANEKNLKLIPNQDLKDFIIEQDDISNWSSLGDS